MLTGQLFPIACLLVSATAYSALGNANDIYVYPRLIESRSVEGNLVLMINEDLRLNMDKTSPFAETLRLVYENDENDYVEENPARLLKGELYKDAENHAALIISRADGLRLKGIIKGNIIIDYDDAPAKDGVVRHRLSIMKLSTNGQYGGDALAYSLDTNELPSGHFQERGDVQTSERAFGHSGLQRVTVRTSVIVSQSYIVGFKNSGYSAVAEVTEYLAVFFALVNMFFEKFSSNILDLQLSVASVILLKKSTETFPRRVHGNPNLIKESTLVALNQFAESKRGIIGEQDIVVYISNFSISSDDTGPNSGHASGYATLGGACTKNRSCLVRDDPRTFRGVYTTVHETLHLLGAVHEGEDAPSYLENSPGARSCYGDRTSVMAAVMQHTELRLSHCTQEQVLAFLK